MGLIDIIYSQRIDIAVHEGDKKGKKTENWYKTLFLYKETLVNIILDNSYKQLGQFVNVYMYIHDTGGHMGTKNLFGPQSALKC